VQVDHPVNINWKGNAFSPIILTLKGSGGHPSLEVKESKIDFQKAFLGETSIKTLTLQNNGTAETMCSIKSDCKFITFDPAPPLFVMPLGIREVDVILKPETIGEFQEEIIVESLENKVGINLIYMAASTKFAFVILKHLCSCRMIFFASK
jgi:hypothetical protein